MNIYWILSTLITIAIIIAYLNHRFIKMQPSGAIMVGALFLSLLLLIFNRFGLSQFELHVEHLILRLHFHDLLINGMLSFLLFAGALTIDSKTFKNERWEILTLASLSTIASAFLIAGLSYYLLQLLNLDLPFKYCMLFGALISPTDPIAVLAMIVSIKAPKRLKVIIAGESLFNDGVGIVIFITTYQFVFGTQQPTFHNVAILFAQETLGGIAYGVLLGWLGNYLINSVNDNKIHILLTIAIATGGYALAQFLQISGPLAMVVSGMFIGNAYFNPAKNNDQQTLKDFWEIVDEILNILLFLLIGFEILIMRHHTYQIIASLLAIPLVLIVRSITIAAPMSIFKKKHQYPEKTISILIWGGLRGGLAVALALALPENHYRDLILSMTYTIVVFAIIIQGTTVKYFIKKSK